ncbi:unnamed protein product [Polarella glacialis]|nr:unnamed protein product [Polarella glacialis]
MLKLLSWDQFSKVAAHPEQVVVSELLGICHQIFGLQALVGGLVFIPGAWEHRLGIETVLNLAIPAVARYFTRQPHPDNFRVLRVAAIYWLVGICWSVLQCAFFLKVEELPKAIVKLLIYVIQWVALARLWRMLQDEQLKAQRFFLNFVVMNKEEVVKAQVQKRTGWGDAVGTKRLGRLAAALANRKFTDEKFCLNLASKIEANIPEKMILNGISAHAELQFQKGSIIVVLVTIENVDIHKLIEVKADAKMADKISWWLSCLPNRAMTEVNGLIMSQLGNNLLTKLPDQIAKEMMEVGGVQVAVEARPPKEEAEYLFALLAQANQHDAVSASHCAH